MNYDEVYAGNTAYFGNPFPEVMAFFQRQINRGRLLDVCCGQGRNAIPLAEMGYFVHGIDTSSVAIEQLIAAAQFRNIHLEVTLSRFEDFISANPFDFILFDGFFQFHAHHFHADEAIFKRIHETVSTTCSVVFCFAERAESIDIFRQLSKDFTCLEEVHIRYPYVDPVSEWRFETAYYVAVCQKKS